MWSGSGAAIGQVRTTTHAYYATPGAVVGEPAGRWGRGPVGGATEVSGADGADGADGSDGADSADSADGADCADCFVTVGEVFDATAVPGRS